MRMSGLCKVECPLSWMAEGPMETERITLSQRERDRLKVLHEVQLKHLSQVAAAERLNVTDRQVRRMLLCGFANTGMVPWFTDYETGHRIASWRSASSRRFWLAWVSAMPTSGPRWPPNTYNSAPVHMFSHVFSRQP